MRSARPNPLVSFTTVRDAMVDLGNGLLTGDFAGSSFHQVTAAELPPPYDGLLAHHKHMTLVLRDRLGKPVALHVADYKLEGNLYSRKIRLTPVGEDRTVELGVFRIDLTRVSKQVRVEILERKTPLGAILIRHNVLRRIEPLWYIHLDERWPGFKQFGTEVKGPAYGRLATIYCDGEPAIELLEIVTQEVLSGASSA